VIALALVLWKLWRFFWSGVWGGSDIEPSLTAWTAGDVVGAEALIRGARGLRARTARAAIVARLEPDMSEVQAREEVTRLALRELRTARRGIGLLEFIATLAPLLGLLGTILGMIEAFGVVDATGGGTTDLASGVWQALITTAIGLGIAIVVSAAATWLNAILDHARFEMEDVATIVFTRGPTRQDG
jgi:biopolymer transport protein ExbB